MQAHPELPEAEVAQRGFATFDERQPLGSDFSAVRHARGEARGGRAIPSGQSRALGEMTYLGFAQTDLEQRSEHAMLFCGAMAGAKVQRVVRVDAVRCGRKAALQGHRVQHREKLIFAVKAAVGGIRAIGRIFHLVRLDEFVVNLEGADKFVDRGAIVCGKTGRQRRDGKRSLAECTLRGPSQVRGVSASGKRDYQRAGIGKASKKGSFLLFWREAWIF